MREPRNLLVTGGAGFIGSAFIRYLFRDPDWSGTIVNLDALTYAGNPANLAGSEVPERYVFVHGSIDNGPLVDELCRRYGIDTVINFAAESHVDRSILGPREFVETNILGVFALLEVIRKLGGIHFHQVSTDEVYGSLGPTGYFVESTPYDPRSPYSASKAAADHLVRAYAHTYGISATLSNCSNNYGPYQFPEKLIPLMILNCLERKPLPVYGNGSNVRDWLYVDDHAEALWLVLRRGRTGRSYNIGGGCELRNIDLLHELIRLVAESTGVDAGELTELITFVADRPGHDQRYAIDSSRIRTELGWQPRHDFASGLRATVAWYLAHRGWAEDVRTGAYREWVAQNYSSRHARRAEA